MHIDKHSLHTIIEEQLKIIVSNAALAASQAYETATHAENKAENKYDTLGLEAAYLAEGQSKRVANFEHNLQAFKKLKVKDFDAETEIHLGALVRLNTCHQTKYVFLSPVSGGIEFSFQNINIMLITESSPLGKALKNNFVGDEIIIKQAHSDITYEIQYVW